MAMFQQWGREELDDLNMPDNGRRLDLLLRSERAMFETLEDCWAEDLRRAQALRWLPKSMYENLKEGHS